MRWTIGNCIGIADSAGRRRLDAVFAGRLALNDDEFFERYFAGTDVPKEVVTGVRRAFVYNLVFDMRRLAPDDRFDRELQFIWRYDSLADAELLCQVEKEFNVSISEAEGAETVTMGALIRLVDRKVKEKKRTARSG